MRRRKKLRVQLLRGAEPRWLIKHPRRAYVRAATLSVPGWVDWKTVSLSHEIKRRITVETGIEHVVDHIVPLNHPYVCGLTVPWNLRIITARQNAAKGNSFNPDQLEFDL